jgi:hypothetical protein
VQDKPVLLQHKLNGSRIAMDLACPNCDFSSVVYPEGSDDGSDSCLRQMPDHPGIVIWGQMIAGFSLRKECDDVGSFVTGFLLRT